MGVMGNILMEIMKNKLIIKYAMFIAIAFFSCNNINAQCLNQVFHTKSTITINGIQVTVIPSGDCDTITTYCSGNTQPYLIGANYTYPNHNGGYTFQFSPPVDSLTLNFGGINGGGVNKEIVKIYINGNHYSISSVGTLNGCNQLAVVTPSGDITGATNGSSSGWSGTIITGPINEISIIDSVVIGVPNGTVFSLYICSKYTNSINENNKLRWLVYPIPTNDKITIEAPNKSIIRISNIQGQTILEQTLQQEKTDIDLSKIAKGFYILRLNYSEKTVLSKIVKE